MKRKILTIMMVVIMLTTILCSVSASSTVIKPKASETKESIVLKDSNEIKIKVTVKDKNNQLVSNAHCVVRSNAFGMQLDSGDTGLFGQSKGKCTLSGNYLNTASFLINLGVRIFGLLIRVEKFGIAQGSATIWPVTEGQTYYRTINLD